MSGHLQPWLQRRLMNGAPGGDGIRDEVVAVPARVAAARDRGVARVARGNVVRGSR
jgi:hypothetical protein